MTLLEAAQGLFGAWRLLHLDRTGLQYFRATREGFWNSFWAAVIVLPADAISSALFVSANPGNVADAGPLRVVAIFLVIYVLQWIVFPLVIAGYTDAIQRSERFVLFIIAHNWANVVRAAILLPAVAIFAADGIGNPGWGAAVFFVSLAAMWIYTGFVARAALDTSVAGANAVVVIEIVIAVLLSSVMDWMTGRV